MKTMTQMNSIAKKTKKWLGKDGCAFFAKELLSEGDWIHIHFREGMQVRNFLRSLTECKDWTDHNFDDNWREIVKQAIQT